MPNMLIFTLYVQYASTVQIYTNYSYYAYSNTVCGTEPGSAGHTVSSSLQQQPGSHLP